MFTSQHIGRLFLWKPTFLVSFPPNGEMLGLSPVRPEAFPFISFRINFNDCLLNRTM